MKGLINIFSIFILAYLLLRFAPAIPISSTVTQKQDLFTVTGTGKVTVIPDTAIISLGITVYQVSTSLTVTVRNLEKINEAIDTATAQGANTISSVQFTVDETRQKELSQQARQEAVKEAKIKAESLSRSAGL